MTYYSSSFRDKAFLGPSDCSKAVDVALKADGSGGVGTARGYSVIPRDYHSDRPAEMLWKLKVGGDELPGLWTLRNGVFKLHKPVTDDAQMANVG